MRCGSYEYAGLVVLL